MNTVLYKALGILALVVTVALVVVFGVRQYGNSRVAAQELSTVKEAVQEAVAARDSAVAVDVQQSQEIAVQGRRVRSVLARMKKEIQDVPHPCADAVGDAERVRLLNIAITEANRVIATTGELSE